MEHIQKDDIIIRKWNFNNIFGTVHYRNILAYPVSFGDGTRFNGICQRTYFLRSWKSDDAKMMSVQWKCFRRISFVREHGRIR